MTHLNKQSTESCKVNSKKGRIRAKLLYMASIVPGTICSFITTPKAASAEGIVKNLGDEVFNIFKYIAYILAIWGVGMLIMSFKNEDADSKSRAIMLLVSAVILFSLKTIFNKLGISL